MQRAKAVSMFLVSILLVTGAGAHSDHSSQDNTSLKESHKERTEQGEGLASLSSGYPGVLELVVIGEILLVAILGFLAFRHYRRTS